MPEAGHFPIENLHSYVQWFDSTGKPLAKATTAPYGYVLRIANGITSVTLKA